MAKLFDWIYSVIRGAYRKTRGRSLSDATLKAARDNYAIGKEMAVDALTNRLMNQQINIQQWVLSFRQELKKAYINQYVTGRGGIEMMTQADWGSIGGQLKRQYEFMNKFAGEIQAGRLTDAQIRQRMNLYFESSKQAYERAKATSHGLPSLPQYPGDGNTQCRTNCKCEWVIEETETEWRCYWKLNPAEHCPDCIDNSQRWNPLVIPKPGVLSQGQPGLIDPEFIRQARLKRLGLE